MAIPVPDPSTAGLFFDLLKTGLDKWEEREEGRRLMAAILVSLRTDLGRNWTSIQDAQEPDMGPQSIANSLDSAQWQLLIRALGTRTRLVDVLSTCYQLMPPGQTVLQPQPWSDRLQQRYEDMSSSLAQASDAITTMLVAEKLIEERLKDEDCRLPRIGAMLDELRISETEQLRILNRWTTFEDGLRSGRCRPYRLAEVQDYLDRKDVLGAIALRRRARTDYPDGQSFELAAGVFELWYRDPLRILYGEDGRSRRAVLDLVRLSGPETARWTPAWKLGRAICRLQSIRPQA